MLNPRVLFVAPSAYTLSGLATWLDYLLPGLGERGWNVTLGLVEGPRHHKLRPYLSQHPFDAVMPIRCTTGTQRGRVRAVRQAVRRIRPDLVVTVNIPDALVATAAERDQCGLAVRAVMTCHGIQADLFADMRLLRNTIDAVVCTNRLACRFASHSGEIDPDRVHYAACGANVPVGNRLASQASPFIIAYVGRLEQPQKRVHDLVPIAKQFAAQETHFRFLVAGNGEEEPAMRAATESAGLASHFEFLGLVSADQLPERVYRQADVVLVPSAWETGPIVVWEAMAQGAAVVSSRYIGSGAEGVLVDGENCLLFNIGDSEAAADQLLRLHQDRSLLDRLATAGRQLIQARYTHNASIERWDAVLRQVLSRPLRCGTETWQPASQVSGRLDRYLGTGLAETARRWSGRFPPDTGPGGEWPHTLSGAAYDNEGFWRLAASLDVREGCLDTSDLPRQELQPC